MKLKKLNVLVMAFSGLLSMVFFFARNVSACSVYINEVQTKTDMRNSLATHLSLPATSIQLSDLSKPMFSFLEGLGADCSGLEAAIITSAYHFSINKNFKKCTYRGVIIQKQSSPEGEYFFNSESPSCVPLISPFPIPGPIHPVIPGLGGR